MRVIYTLLEKLCSFNYKVYVTQCNFNVMKH